MDAYQRGILTSTTLMANMPGFEHAVKLRKEMPRLGVGVHLTLTCKTTPQNCRYSYRKRRVQILILLSASI